MGRITINLLVISMFFCEVNSCWGQFRVQNYENRNFEIIVENVNSDEYAVEYYLVIEKVNCRFGGYETRYKVSNLNLVNTYPMGENNTRTVKAVYKKVKPKIKPIEGSLLASNLVEKKADVALTVSDLPVGGTIKPDVAEVSEKTERIKPEYVYVDILKTYEGVLEKGYFTTEMLKKVADSRFFKNDLVKAAQWYSKLFEMTTDLEPVYYYRYAQSLFAINQNVKAKEMMLTYEFKSTAASTR